MTVFSKREAAKIAAKQAREETDQIFKDARDNADRLGTLTVDEESATIWMDGHIGPNALGCVDAVSVRDAMRTLKGRPVTLRINSQGGSVNEGMEIYLTLKEHKGGLTTRGNLVASMASMIFQTGTERIMESTGRMMIHGPHCDGGGTAADHAKTSEMLKIYAETCVPIYAQRSGKSQEAIRRLLETETWYTPSDAVSEGFADSVAGRVTTGRPKLAAARRAAIRSRSETLRMDELAMVAAYCID